MDLKIPVAYSCEVLEFRKRKKVRKDFGEWLEADIPDIPSEDAPVALRWKNPDHPVYGTYNDGLLNRTGETMETRWYDGSHWMPFFEKQNEDRAEGKIIQSADIQGLLDAGHLHNLPFFGTDWRMSEILRGEISPLKEEDFKEVDFSGRDEELDRLSRTLNDLIFVDGQLWQRKREPVYDASRINWFENAGREGSYPIRFIPNAVDDNGKYERKLEDLWRADQYAELCERLPEDIRERIVGPEIEVLIPESLKYDPHGLALMAAVGTALEFHLGMETWSSEKGIAYYQMRDAFNLAQGSADENGMPPADLVDLVLEKADGYATADGNGSITLKKVVERLQNRPIEIEAPRKMAM